MTPFWFRLRMSKKPLPLSLSIGDEKIMPADSVRNLRMILTSYSLTLKLHVNKVCRSANYQLHRISSVRKCFDDATCEILISSLVFPYLDYGCCRENFHTLFFATLWQTPH